MYFLDEKDWLWLFGIGCDGRGTAGEAERVVLMPVVAVVLVVVMVGVGSAHVVTRGMAETVAGRGWGE